MRGRFVILLAVSAPLLTVACGRGGGSAPALPPPPTPMPPPLVLYSDNGSDVREQTRIVIRDAATLDDYWARATAARSTPPPAPTVVFDREMVILVAMGPATPEEEIHVDSLLIRRELNSEGEQEETLSIVVRSVKGCGRFRTEAFPLEILRARRFDGPVRWEERRQQVECEAVPAERQASSAATGAPPAAVAGRGNR